MWTREFFIKCLREKGLKVTPQRLAIIDMMIEKGHLHPSAGLVFEEARKKLSGLSLSTVYATLQEFYGRGIFKKLEFDRMENRFDRNVNEHLHLICRKCGNILDFPLPDRLDNSELERISGFKITDSRLEYYGICGECREIGRNDAASPAERK
jgi:Fur family peroxide stress response transcriptional regulator